MTVLLTACWAVTSRMCRIFRIADTSRLIERSPPPSAIPVEHQMRCSRCHAIHRHTNGTPVLPHHRENMTQLENPSTMIDEPDGRDIVPLRRGEAAALVIVAA